MWKKEPWPYDPSVTAETWVKTFSGRTVYVRDQPHFPYTVKGQYSGQMPDYIFTIEQAKVLLDKFIPEYLQTGNPNIEKARPMVHYNHPSSS